MKYRWILMLMLTVLASQSSVYAQSSPSFTELIGFSGATLKPGGNPIIGAGLGVGSGKNLISMELSHVSLGGYGLGEGPSFVSCQSGCTDNNGGIVPPFEVEISQAAVVNFTGNYTRDIYHSSKLMIFGTAGGGFSSSRYSRSGDAGQTYERERAATLAYGGGLRVPLAKGFGIRVDIKEWFYNIDNPTPGTNRLTNATVGLYYRWFNHL